LALCEDSKVAESWGLRPQFSNPCRYVKKFKEFKREGFLSREELRRLGEALRIEEEFAPSAAATHKSVKSAKLKRFALSAIKASCVLAKRRCVLQSTL
jgi:hypothetical protein